MLSWVVLDFVWVVVVVSLWWIVFGILDCIVFCINIWWIIMVDVGIVWIGIMDIWYNIILDYCIGFVCGIKFRDFVLVDLIIVISV